MPTLNEILQEMEGQQVQQLHPIPQKSRRKDRTGPKSYGSIEDRKKAEFELVGHPLMVPLKWDDLGLGMVRSFGFIGNKVVHIRMTHDKWTISGARVTNSIVYYLLSGGGLLYFLQDLLRFTNLDIIGTVAIIIIPVLLNLAVRVKSFEFYPFEVEFFGYDSQSHVLILSTLTQPGGVVALKIEIPGDKRARQIEQAKLIESLQKSHAGFIRIDGLVKQDYSAFKSNIGQALMWGVIILLGYMMTK